MSDKFKLIANEKLLWKSDISQAVYFKNYALLSISIIISFSITLNSFFIGILGVIGSSLYAFELYVRARDTSYELTSERIRIVIGGMFKGRKTYDIDLDDLKDIELYESFLNQQFKIGTLKLIFLGDVIPNAYQELYRLNYHILNGIKFPEKSRELIRATIKKSSNMVLAHSMTFKFEQENQPQVIALPKQT